MNEWYYILDSPQEAQYEIKVTHRGLMEETFRINTYGRKGQKQD